jgi:biotin carboxylase
MVVRGVKTTIPLGQLILKDIEFRRGKYSTHFVQSLMEQRAQMMPKFE